MKNGVIALCVVLGLGSFAGMAEAKGCLKGAAAGAMAGHYAGRHAVMGAIAGCAVGRHLANKKSAAPAPAVPARP